MDTPFVVSLRKVWRESSSDVTFNCHGASCYDDAIRMILLHTRSVREGEDERYKTLLGKKTADPHLWGDPLKDFPEWRLIVQREKYASIEMYVDGVYTPSTVRTGASETIDLYETFVVSVTKRAVGGQSTVVFTCKNAVSKAMAFAMVMEHIFKVRAGLTAPAAIGESWGAPYTEVPPLRETGGSGNMVDIDWCEGVPTTMRCGANINITLMSEPHRYTVDPPPLAA